MHFTSVRKRRKPNGRLRITPDWLDDYATQVAAAWVLSCVFVRFLEDNALHETPLIAGPFGQADNENHGNHGNHKSPDSHKSHSPEATDNRLQQNEG